MNWMMTFVILSWKKQNNCHCGVSAAGVAVDDEEGNGWYTSRSVNQGHNGGKGPRER